MSGTICDDCSNHWDCDTPCQEVIAWQELEDKDRVPPRQYVAKGVPLFTRSGAQIRKEKAAKGGLNGRRVK